MKIILTQDHDKLGKAGTTVNVKDGYAMNYLIPNKIALKANDGNLKVLEELQKQKASKVDKLTDEANKLSAELEKLTLEIKAKAGEEDKLFGSVTSQNISDALAQKGYTIDKKNIELKDPIKQLGIYSIEISLFNNVKSSLKVWITKE